MMSIVSLRRPQPARETQPASTFSYIASVSGTSSSLPPSSLLSTPLSKSTPVFASASVVVKIIHPALTVCGVPFPLLFRSFNTQHSLRKVLLLCITTSSLAASDMHARTRTHTLGFCHMLQSASAGRRPPRGAKTFTHLPLAVPSGDQP